ncbi:unnamed protein product [Owenia fusiformis]|nr:unnamed protein product [Owenia fusiformis]
MEALNLQGPKDEKYRYNMKHPKRGMAIIINNKSFDPETRQQERKGSDVDASNIRQQLHELGFKPEVKTNQTVKEMLGLMKKAGSMDHSQADCFACVILSHGNDNGEVYGKDATVSIDTLTEPLKGNNCASLAGKPKLFFIQACRGSKLDEGIEVTDGHGGDDIDETNTNTTYRIPAEADFLMAYSVVPGYFAWRNSREGSWFIQALCIELEEHGEDPDFDILKIMTRVNRRVAFDFQSNNPRIPAMNQMKQIPSIVSMLTKELYFTPKDDD